MNTRFCSPGRILPYLFYFSLLYLLLWCWKPARAQSVAAYKPLQIGDTVPDVTINNILHYKTPTAKLSDFKGKLLILDFWATWCSPCVAMIPRMDSLQKQFEDQVQFLPVTYQSIEVVTAFFEKYAKRHRQRIMLPEVVKDSVLQKLFYHNAIPHYVWINTAGIVVAFTSTDEINSKKISAFLLNEKLVLTQKKDPLRIPFDQQQPFLINGNGGDGSKLLYHSIFSEYTPGLSGEYAITELDNHRGIKLTATNQSRLSLYKKAYGERDWIVANNRIVLEVRDPDRFTTTKTGDTYRQWMKQNNGFCYEIITPPALASRIFSMMRDDLACLFSEYESNLEKRDVECLILTRIRPDESLRSQGGKPVTIVDSYQFTGRNVSVGSFIRHLNIKYMQRSPLPVLDETGIRDMIDMDIQANLSDPQALNKELQKYGLRFIRASRKVDMLVIRDKKS